MTTGSKLALLEPWHRSFDTNVEAETAIVIVASPRSGSTMLASSLWSTGRLGYPAEYFNMEVMTGFAERGWSIQPTVRGRLGRIRRRRTGGHDTWNRYRRRDLQPYLRQALTERVTPNGVFGLKIFSEHSRLLRLQKGGVLAELPEHTIVIHLHRRDSLGQAISWVRALQTSDWFGARSPSAEPRYDRAAIERQVAKVEVESGQAADLARTLQGLRIDLSYEDLTIDLPGCVGAIAEALGVDLSGRIEPFTSVQRDERSENWRARYLEGR